MQQIYLPIKRIWFNAIVDKTKTIEYRDIKPFYDRMFSRVQAPFVLRLRAGYTLACPVVRVIVSKVSKNVESGKYELHISDILAD